MKVILSSLLFSFLAIQVFGAPADQCEEQAPCIDFTVTTMTTPSCNIGIEPCAVEVCLFINGTHVNEHGECMKGSTVSFSHMCHQSDENGCAVYETDANGDETGIPVFNNGNTTDCSLSGEGTNGTAFTGKCDSGNNVLMCQEGHPGDTLYWIIKDGTDETIEPENPIVLPFEWHDEFNCMAHVECSNHNYTCEDNGGDLAAGEEATAQQMKERTWAFTIPDHTEGDECSPCNHPETPPAPTPISGPNPPPPTDVGLPFGPPPSNPPPSTTGGDPHFKTWKQEHFQYHGQCDLVLAQDPEFAGGLGLDVHIRTKLVRYWSYIKTAVIRIGNDILEIEGSAVDFDSQTHYWINYDYQGDLETFAGFPVKMYSAQGTRVTKNRIEIDLDSKYPGVKINLSTFKEFIKVDFTNPTPAAFENTVGMLGDFKTGKTLGRDGVTEIHDWTSFGHEWQVLPADNKFFRESSVPQFPESCIEPENPQGGRARRLGESSISEEQAELACAGLKDELDRKDCVYDIIATQDLDMAGAF